MNSIAETLECPACENPNARLRYRMSDRFFKTSHEEFLLYGCGSCGMLFQNQEIEGRLSEFYPPGYWWQESGKVSRLEKAYREWMVRRDHLKFLLAVGLEPASRLLDIGCGSGTFVKLAIESGVDAFGLEQSEQAVEIGEKSIPGRIFHGSEKELAERGEKFDIVTLFHALEHMTSPFKYLKSIHKLLNKPGKIIVQVPNVSSLQAKLLGRLWYGLDCPRHVCNYSTFAVLHLLGRAGYRIQRVRHFSLRDNAAGLVSSLFPPLDIMSQRVQLLRRSGRLHSPTLSVKELIFFGLLVTAQPFALMEAALGRGATVTVYATLD